MVRYCSAKECDASLVGMIGKPEIGYRNTLYIWSRDLFDPSALYWIDDGWIDAGWWWKWNLQ